MTRTQHYSRTSTAKSDMVRVPSTTPERAHAAHRALPPLARVEVRAQALGEVVLGVGLEAGEPLGGWEVRGTGY